MPTRPEPIISRVCDADFTAYARIRIMNDAYRELSNLSRRYEKGSVPENDFINIATACLSAYEEQFISLPASFQDYLGDSDNSEVDFEVLSVFMSVQRNNIAHSYLAESQNPELLKNFIDRELPIVHAEVMRYSDKEGLESDHLKYPSNRRNRPKNIFGYTKISKYSEPHGIISENRRFGFRR